MLKIQNGIVIDHITPGKGIKIYEKLKLDSLNHPIILMRNIPSDKHNLKDVIKIENIFDISVEFLGLLDSNITINYIKEQQVIKKVKAFLPLKVKGIIKCKNPRCISFKDEFILPEFTLNDAKNGYHCNYCEETTYLKQIEL
ncbi:aspartate carbamoyltransferase regulatory subunit [Anaerobranca gottschalkii]|uniref:Aspartate carbamoyltransferase regulatory subunit n=1 Tax=Anaerobranca gottschalkii DSM 13577 TaxID=1120990 RepID=A0A1H9YJC4_9FIRM|nr:aspartate carbamoyltransferase regulatory subunit [Anaerobranca gottschalkii]SES68682.1 aspartate carbamoyltransferase regulatory subunit [Anaerobranca gottschalkii DSM 13577]